MLQQSTGTERTTRDEPTKYETTHTMDQISLSQVSLSNMPETLNKNKILQKQIKPVRHLTIPFINNEESA